MSEAEVGALHARRVTVDDKPGYPCRVSLADAEVGESTLLLPFVHHDVSSVDYLHIHNAYLGCYCARVVRSG